MRLMGRSAIRVSTWAQIGFGIETIELGRVAYISPSATRVPFQS